MRFFIHWIIDAHAYTQCQCKQTYPLAFQYISNLLDMSLILAPFIAFFLANIARKSLGFVIGNCWWDQIYISHTKLWEITIGNSHGFLFSMHMVLYATLFLETHICMQIFFIGVACSLINFTFFNIPQIKHVIKHPILFMILCSTCTSIHFIYNSLKILSNH